jgi:crossover junction endodeoxyribonuclease RusA
MTEHEIQVSAFAQYAARGTSGSVMFAIPPSLNSCFANVAGKGRVKTAQYRAWQKAALAEIAAQARGLTFAGRFRVEVLASDQGLTRRRDADNLGKAVCDTLKKAGIIEDDDYLHMRAIALSWDSTIPAGQCSVTVIALAHEALSLSAPKRKAKTKQLAGIPDSIMKALAARGINVSPEKVRVQ